MEENDLSLPKNFSTAHITAMMHWNEMREMMDVSLGDVVLEKFQKVTQGISKTRADTNFRGTGNYIYSAGELFWLEIGYFIDEIDERLYIGGAIAVDLTHQEKEKIIQAFREFNNEKDSWELIDEDDDDDSEEIWIEKLRPVEEGVDIHLIQDWFLEILEDVEAFQKANPHLFWN